MTLCFEHLTSYAWIRREQWKGEGMELLYYLHYSEGETGMMRAVPYGEGG